MKEFLIKALQKEIINPNLSITLIADRQVIQNFYDEIREYIPNEIIVEEVNANVILTNGTHIFTFTINSNSGKIRGLNPDLIIVNSQYFSYEQWECLSKFLFVYRGKKIIS